MHRSVQSTPSTSLYLMHVSLTVNATKREPESTIRGECGSTKCVTRRKLPHAGQKLGKTTIGKSHTENDIGCFVASSVHIVHGKDECGGGETHQSERSRVGKLSVKDWVSQEHIYNQFRGVIPYDMHI